MIELINMRFKKMPSMPYDFFVDRRSPVGSPYYLNKEADRDNVCNNYEKYFNEMVKRNNHEFMEYLWKMLMVYNEYGKLRLFCWCTPKRCHGETIKRWLEEQAQ